MLDLMDLLLLRRGVPTDDRTQTFNRIDGNPAARVIYFLPWRTPFNICRQTGCIPLDFFACYEMPPAIVSSEPELSVSAMLTLVADAEARLAAHEVRARDMVIVGLSVGCFPATYLANRIGARLCAVAPADRADMMLWQSPAARIVKRRAALKGYRLSHYSKVMDGFHPVQNLAGVASDSMFVIGRRDPFVPQRRAVALRRAITIELATAQVVTLDAGHVRTLIKSGRYQRAMLGLVPPPRWNWRPAPELAFLRPPGDDTV
jgi:pimeloyl-ACP methyl ester carboxylesterase